MSSATRTLVRSSSHAFAASLVGVTLGLALSIVVARALGPHQQGRIRFGRRNRNASFPSVGFVDTERYHLLHSASGVSAARPLVVLVFGAGAVRAWLRPSCSHSSPRRVSRMTSAAPPRTLFEDRRPWSCRRLLYCVLAKAILIGRQRVALASWLDIVGRAITLPILVLIGVGVVGGGPTVDRFAAATLIGGVVGTLVILRSVLLLDPTPNGKAGLKSVMRFSTPAYAANVLQYLNYRLDLFLVAYFRGLKEVGLYALATSLAQLIWLVSGAVATAVLARVGSGLDEPNEVRYAQLHLHAAYYDSNCVSPDILAVVAQPLLRILYGDAFEPAASALWLLLPGIVLLGAATVVSAAHVAEWAALCST